MYTPKRLNAPLRHSLHPSSLQATQIVPPHDGRRTPHVARWSPHVGRRTPLRSLQTPPLRSHHPKPPRSHSPSTPLRCTARPHSPSTLIERSTGATHAMPMDAYHAPLKERWTILGAMDPYRLKERWTHTDGPIPGATQGALSHPRSICQGVLFHPHSICQGAPLNERSPTLTPLDERSPTLAPSVLSPHSSLNRTAHAALIAPLNTARPPCLIRHVHLMAPLMSTPACLMRA